MKKSLAAFSAWALILALSVFVPIYILLTGTASLMPIAQFGAVLAGLAGVIVACLVAATIRKAERQADISAHQALTKTRDLLEGKPLWKSGFVILRYLLQVLLLLALGQPLFAAFALSGFVGIVLHRGMLDAYFDRLPSNRARHGVGEG